MSGTTAAVIAGIGLILTVLNICDKIVVLTKAAQQPEKDRDKRVKELEDNLADFRREVGDKVKEYDDNIMDNMENINAVRDTMLTSTAIIMRSLQALIAHDLDGNNTADLKECKREINEYLLTGHPRGGRVHHEEG